MNRAFAALAVLLAASPAVASAQSPRPSPAITGTQSKIANARKQQLHAQAAPKKMPAQQTATGGSHPDSEAPNNPGQTQNKPKGGPGYGGGNPTGN